MVAVMSVILVHGPQRRGDVEQREHAADGGSDGMTERDVLDGEEDHRYREEGGLEAAGHGFTSARRFACAAFVASFSASAHGGHSHSPRLWSHPSGCQPSRASAFGQSQCTVGCLRTHAMTTSFGGGGVRVPHHEHSASPHITVAVTVQET